MTREKRWDVALVALAAVIAIVIAVSRVPHFIIYNQSPSVPVGFYIRINEPLRVGAFVTVGARDVAPVYARLRGFADIDDRFIKRIAAVTGARVCADGNSVVVDGALRVRRFTRDRAGRALPTWNGCRTLDREVFLLGDTPDSFDGRYWGPIPVSHVEGVWRRI